LAEHNDDAGMVILDSLGNVLYYYEHIPNSQSLGVEKAVKN
jgi:hypothetical protein